jgi:hypothetical protein
VFPPTDNRADPFPGKVEVATFGSREGSFRALEEDGTAAKTNICMEYKRNLGEVATDVRDRHASIVFIDDANCTFSKYKPGRAQRGDFEMHFSELFSGKPHFQTMLAAHRLPRCNVLVFVNEWDDNFMPTWTKPWPFYRDQVDAAAETIIEHGAVPKDISASQMMNVGHNITLIDYEYWTPLPDQKAPEYKAAKHYQTSTVFKYKLDIWMDWLRAGNLGGVAEGGDTVVSKLHDMFPHGEQNIFDRFAAPLHVEGAPCNAGHKVHCLLLRHLLGLFAPGQQSSSGGALQVAGVGVGGAGQQEQGMVLATPEYIASSFKKAVGSLGGVRVQAMLEVQAMQFDPVGGISGILKMDIVVFQIIVTRAEPTEAEKWGGELLHMLAESDSKQKPAVIVVFVWNGDSSWPQPTWSKWHRNLLDSAQTYLDEGRVDISTLGTWFDPLPVAPARGSAGSKGVLVTATSQSTLEDHQVEKPMEALFYLFASQLLSPTPPECASEKADAPLFVRAH